METLEEQLKKLRERWKEYKAKGDTKGMKIVEIKGLILKKILNNEIPNRRLRLFEKKGVECHYCGEVADTVDHVIPKSKGGKNSMDNLVPCCKKCNLEKSDRSYQDYTFEKNVEEVFLK